MKDYINRMMASHEITRLTSFQEFTAQNIPNQDVGSFDCGIYLIHYCEHLIKHPEQNYFKEIPDCYSAIYRNNIRAKLKTRFRLEALEKE